MAKVALLGVPLDLGANRRGVDMGPSAIRVTNLLERLKQIGHDAVDRGDIDVPLPEEADVGDATRKYADDIRDVCEDLCNSVVRILKDGRVPVVMGGDHSLAMGSMAGVAKHFRDKGKPIGCIWFDAHGDMNTPESSGSGNVHGMPLAHVLGMGDEALKGIGGISPKVTVDRCVLVGIRDLDDSERKIIHASGVRVITMKEIDRVGMARVIEDAIEIASKGTAGIHVSFDVDALDPSVAPGVGTPKRGGLNYREAHLSMEIISDSKLMTSMDLVEVNPILDNRNHTAEMGAELILSALGKSIY